MIKADDEAEGRLRRQGGREHVRDDEAGQQAPEIGPGAPPGRFSTRRRRRRVCATGGRASRFVCVDDSPVNGRGVDAGRAYPPGETVLVADDSRVVDAEHTLDPAKGEFAHPCDTLAAGLTVLMPRAGTAHQLLLRPEYIVVLPKGHVGCVMWSCLEAVTAAHLAMSLGLLLYTFGTGMARFDQGTPASWTEVAAGIVVSSLGFPVLTLLERHDVLRFPGLVGLRAVCLQRGDWYLAVAPAARHRRPRHRHSHQRLTRWFLAIVGVMVLATGVVAVRQLPAVGAGGLLHPSRRHVAVAPPAGCSLTTYAGAGIQLQGWRCEAVAARRASLVYLHGVAGNRSEWSSE